MSVTLEKRRWLMRRMTSVAIMSAISFILMMLEFSLPFLPSFLKYDFSDFPALIISFAYGPIAGVLVELLKNVLHLPLTQTSGVGELANFLIGMSMVAPSGLIYKYIKTKKGALIGSSVGTITASLVSLPVNLYITYPFYYHFMDEETILSLYQVLFPRIQTVANAIVCVNMPFTLGKGVITVVLTMLLYKKLSPILKGIKKENNNLIYTNKNENNIQNSPREDQR